MSGGRRDVEDDLRHQLSRDAVICEKQLRHGSMTSVDSVLDYLVGRAYRSPDRLLDARDLLGQQDARRAADPQPAGQPRPFAPPDAPADRYGRPVSEDDGTSWPGLDPVVELVDVLPVKDVRRAVSGGRLFVTSVELWSNAVRWHIFQTVQPYHHPFQSVPLYEMGDDVGTSYRIGGGGGSSNGAAWQESAVFMPAPPAAARAIYLRGGHLRVGDQVVVQLPAEPAQATAPPT
jgi:hypothetical protein